VLSHIMGKSYKELFVEVSAETPILDGKEYSGDVKFL